jgi:lipopolysaccharide cholinephosphotransferase
MKKETKFKKVLESAKDALDSINVPFHLHAGTALGAHREKTFIPHDHDIDLGVFIKDANDKMMVKLIVKSMKAHGFSVVSRLGKLSRGKEIQFEKNDIPLDIFWIYPGNYRGKNYYLVSSYFGDCDKLKFKTCVWGYRPYRLQTIDFLGKKYKVVPKKTLVDMYGNDWKVPKQFTYWEGLDGGYKGFLKDYYEPRPKNLPKVAFCFLTYNNLTHEDIWVKFFKQDNYPTKSFSLYSHIKKVSSTTPTWLKKHAVRTANTDWCGENLVWAWIKMLKAAIKDKNNQYFALLSGACIPLYDFAKTYKKITSSKKSRIHISKTARVYKETGLYYSDQWVILNRECAELLIKLRTTSEGKKFYRKTKKTLSKAENPSCPDEIYPINWFIKHFGKPHTSKFKKHIRDKVSTFTEWDKFTSSPKTLDIKSVKIIRTKICNSGAIFARKFTKGAAKKIALSC